MCSCLSKKCSFPPPAFSTPTSLEAASVLHHWNEHLLDKTITRCRCDSVTSSLAQSHVLPHRFFASLVLYDCL